jgi:hypothetical protein
MKKLNNFLLFLVLILSLTTLGFSQGRQTGAINGKVVYTDGSPLPGARVTLSGPALIGTKTFVTNAEGRFRFPALAPGENFSVRVELSGFQTTIRDGLIVNVGRNTEIEIELSDQSLEEEVTVTADSPVVDIATSKVSVNYSASFIASIPMNRDLYDIQNSLPGAIADGADYRRTSSILGGTVRSTLYALDGVPMNDPATFYSMANINIDVYEEMEVGIGALPAEVGQTDSAFINIVTKSGGNRFSGQVTGYYTGESLTENMVSLEDISAFGVDEPEKYLDYKDLSFNFGGPVIKDRAWFFVNGRRLLWGRANPLVPETRLQNIADANPGMFTDVELSHYDLDHEEWLGFGKLTFQITPRIKYMGMLHYNHIYEPVYSNRTSSSYSWAYTAVYNHENTYTTTHQLNWILNQNTFLDIRGTFIHRFFPINSRPEFAGNYSTYDRNYAVSWGNTFYDDEYIRKKYLASASITRFEDEFLGASHELKAGFEFEQTEYHRDWFRPGGNPYYSYWYDFNDDNPYYYSTSGRRGRLRIRMCPGEAGLWDVQDNTRRFSGYLQDSAVFGRLAVNVGLRIDKSFQYEPVQTRPYLPDTYNVPAPLQNPALGTNDLLLALMEQWRTDYNEPSPWDELTTPYKRPVDFLTLSPRIGFVYDLFGDSKTALKVSFARYYEPVWSAKYNSAQIFGANSVNFYWYDLDRNKLMDLPGIDRYVPTAQPNQDPNYSYYPDDLKPPYMHEFMAGIEHEVIADFKLGFQFIYKINKNIVEDIDVNNGYDPALTDENGPVWIPYTFTDPGWDLELGTSDDQQLTVYNLREDRPVPTWGGANPPEAERKYWATILTFDKRMTNNWQLKGSIMYSRFKGNTSPEYGATEGSSSMFDDPNVMINSYGSVAFDRPFQVRIMGTYVLPYDIILSAYIQHRSGTAWGRSFSRVYFSDEVADQGQDSYVSVWAEPDGTRRNPAYTNIDLRMEKAFHFGERWNLNVYMDIFNLGGRGGVNVNQDHNLYYRGDRDPVEWYPSTTHGLITSVYGVRSIRLGARFSF